jgi:uncharacterized protein YukE
MSDDGRELLRRGGPGGHDIYVDPDALRRTASAFDGHAGRFAAAVRDFESAARLPAGALGRLPEAHGVNQQYEDSHRAAAQALRDIHDVVTGIADGLRGNADVYDGADQP